MRAGPYVPGAELAEGGTATVYDAVGPGGPVVLKVLRRALSDDPGWVRRFERELDALTRLAHPAVLNVLDHGVTDDGRPYLVLPKLEGRTLRALLDARGALPERTAWSLARPVAEALAAAHAAGVIHRDVKPENVFLVRDGERESPRLIDFGMARDLADTTRVTATGTPVGTPSYMSPEQWWSHGVGPASDQYAFAVTLYEMLAGHTPFRAEGFAAQMQGHVSTAPPSLAASGVTASPEVEGLVARALSKDPAARFDSMDALITAGDAAFGHAATTPVTSPRARRWVWPLASLAASIAAGYAGSHDPRAWARIAGFGGPVTALAFVAVWALAARRPISPALALIPAAIGALNTFTGWSAVLSAVARAAPTARLALYQEGLYEANVGRAIGYLWATGLIAASLASRPTPRPSSPLARASNVAASAMVLAAVFLALAGAPVVAIVPGVCAAMLFASAPSRPTRAGELSAAVARLGAALLAWAGARTLLEARAASSWSADFTRAERVAEVLRSARESVTLHAVALLCLAVTASVSAWRASRVTSTSWRPSRGGLALLATACAWSAIDGAFVARMRDHRDALWRDLSPAFALGARLSPPVAEGLPRPPLGPSLQVTEGRIAVDGTPVALVRALDSLEGRRVLAADLSHRLARGGATEASELLIAVDGRVAWRVARDTLRIARDLGARRATVLFTRGPAPRIDAAAPPEAGYALPHDFGGLAVSLSESGEAFEASTPFAEVGARLVARRSVAVSVDR